MQAVTDATFNNMVLMSEKLVLVFFWATWSGPSRLEAPVLQQIANEHTDTLSVVQLDIDQNPQTPRTYNVLQVPTMNLYRDGEVVMQIVGAKPKAALLQDLDGFISSAPPTTTTGTTTTTTPTTTTTAPTTVPLLRAFSPGSGDHFYTTDVAERDNAVAKVGYVNEGVTCQVLPAAGTGTTPLLRAFNPTNGDHFYTTSAAERDNAVANGYRNEGIACHVFPSQ
jgi:thioredoxin 1